MLQEKLKIEEHMRKSAEDRVSEKTKELLQAYQEVSQLQIQLQKYESPTSVDILKEKHIALGKELKVFIFFFGNFQEISINCKF